MRQRITSVTEEDVKTGSIHEKEDIFSHLPVNVSEEGFDIYDGLAGYFEDYVEFEGRQAKMDVTLLELPPILQIQLQVMSLLLFYRKNHPHVPPARTIRSQIRTSLQIACICQIWRDSRHGPIFGECRR